MEEARVSWVRPVVAIVSLLVVAAMLAVGSPAEAAKGTNNANAKLCQKDGWASLWKADGGTFASQEECVEYGAAAGEILTEDPDRDGDGIFNDSDNCPDVANPNQADLDQDGLGDFCDTDIDGDGLNNTDEGSYGTDPLDSDSDSDGLSDGEETACRSPNLGACGPDPISPTVSEPLLSDTDGDGLNDGAEVNTYGTDPRVADTDGDGLTDKQEIDLGTDPLSNLDSDADGLSDDEEVFYGTDPTKADTDGDGLTDGAEVNDLGTNPNSADSDGDGLTDRAEAHYWMTDPVVSTVRPTVPGVVYVMAGVETQLVAYSNKTEGPIERFEWYSDILDGDGQVECRDLGEVWKCSTVVVHNGLEAFPYFRAITAATADQPHGVPSGWGKVVIDQNSVGDYLFEFPVALPEDNRCNPDVSNLYCFSPSAPFSIALSPPAYPTASFDGGSPAPVLIPGDLPPSALGPQCTETSAIVYAWTGLVGSNVLSQSACVNDGDEALPELPNYGLVLEAPLTQTQAEDVLTVSGCEFSDEELLAFVQGELSDPQFCGGGVTYMEILTPADPLYILLLIQDRADPYRTGPAMFYRIGTGQVY